MTQLLWCHESVDWRVEWHSVVFSDDIRFCLYASDGRTRVRRSPGERHLPECIRPLHIDPTSGFMVLAAISYNMRLHFVLLQGKLNRLLTPCYCHFFDKKVICFFDMITHVHIRLLPRNVPFVVYNCPGQTRSPISRQLKA